MLKSLVRTSNKTRERDREREETDGITWEDRLLRIFMAELLCEGKKNQAEYQHQKVTSSE